MDINFTKLRLVLTELCPKFEEFDDNLSLRKCNDLIISNLTYTEGLNKLKTILPKFNLSKDKYLPVIDSKGRLL